MAFVTSKDKLVQLTYSFMFSRRDNIWNNISEFEHDLEKFFAHKGLEAEAITFVEGSSGHRTLYLRDVSQEMKLRNDRDVFRAQQMAKKAPEKSYKTTEKLVNRVNSSIGGK